MQKNYILDTNVLLDNPNCIEILRGNNENNIYLPITVIRELDKLKKDRRLRYIVAQVVQNISNSNYVKVIGSINCKSEKGDFQILEDIKYSKINNPIIVTNDGLFQLVCKYNGFKSQPLLESFTHKVLSQSFTGFITDTDEFIPNSFSWIDGKPFMNLNINEKKCIDYEHEVWGVKPLNVYQNLAFELLLSDHIHLVTIQSKSGYGKSYITLATALHQVIQKKKFNKIYLVKPTIEIGESLGFLPGNIDEKVDPYVRYLRDLIYRLHQNRGSKCKKIFTDDSTVEKMKLNSNIFEILPISFIRGMNIENAFVMVDETQNMSRVEIRSLLTRMGNGTKCVCLGDVEQIDNRYLTKHNNGLNWIVKTCLGDSGYGHIVLKGNKSRGPICDMVINHNL